jgi:ketosteroid isomerase-like protein
MSALDVVKATWASWEARDTEAVVEHLRPDVVHDLSHYAGWPGEPRHVGVGHALASLGDWMTWWQGYRQELVGFEESGDRVLALVRHTGTRDGERIDEDLALLFYVDDGRVACWEPWSDVEAARAALRA